MTLKIVSNIPILDLVKGTVIEQLRVGTSETTGVPGVNKSYKITTEDGESWILKLRNDEHISRWRYIPPRSQYKREKAAYLVDRQLGFNLVPYTKIVRYKGDVGSCQEWIENAKPSDPSLNSYSDDTIWKMGLLDAVIGQTDRHSGNWLNIDHSICAIDNGYSFPSKADFDDPRSVILSRFVYRIWGKKIPDRYLESLKRLKDSKFQSRLKFLLDPPAVDLFNERLNYLLRGYVKFPKYKIHKKISKIPPEKKV